MSGTQPDGQQPHAALLSLDNVTTYYAEIRILEGISLHIGEGELVCLLGGNASGKSTTLKTILGIVRPRAGRVLIDGTDVTSWPVPQRIARGIAIVPENRRRLEIARALATKPRLLLLDEPAAGMNPAETHEVTELISRLRDERGVSILVIEHDMHVVSGCSDRVIALDHGVKIAEGRFDEVASHPAVVEAYLGRDPEALADTE